MKTLTRIIGTGLILAGVGSAVYSANLYEDSLRANPELAAKCKIIEKVEHNFKYNNLSGETIDEKFQNISREYSEYKRRTAELGLVEQCEKAQEYATPIKLGLILATIVGVGGIMRLWNYKKLEKS